VIAAGAPPVSAIGAPAAARPAAPAGRRGVVFTASSPVETTVFRRDDLGPGAVVPGPAVIEQADATTLVPPGARARVDDAGNLVLKVQAQ
jgi:N-methylhydantoinase A